MADPRHAFNLTLEGRLSRGLGKIEALMEVLSELQRKRIRRHDKLLGIVNHYVLQWLFIRCTRVNKRQMVRPSLTLNNFWAVYEGVGTFWYGLQVFVVPMSGYKDRPFKYLGKQKILRITKIYVYL